MTVPLPVTGVQTTYILVLVGLQHIATGLESTGMVAVTVLVAGLMTETEAEPWLATNTFWSIES